MGSANSDESLLLKFRNGDVDAFSELYSRHKDALYRYFLRQVQQSAHAEELAQDVWTSVIYSVDTYSEMAKFTTYLYRIARNRLIDASRRQKLRAADSLDNIDDMPADATLEPEQRVDKQRQYERIKQLVKQLPEQQRDAFLLKEECGLGIADISQICHCNEETIKSRLRYAYARLREGMKSFALHRSEKDRRADSNAQNNNSHKPLSNGLNENPNNLSETPDNAGKTQSRPGQADV